MTDQRCLGFRKDGTPCPNRARESGYCWFHDPTLTAERAAARSAGGRARQGRQVWRTVNGDEFEPGNPTPQVDLQTPTDVLALLNRAVNDTLRLENSNLRNRTLGTLAMAALKVFEVGELAARIAALEQEIRRS